MFFCGRSFFFADGSPSPRESVGNGFLYPTDVTPNTSVSRSFFPRCFVSCRQLLLLRLLLPVSRESSVCEGGFCFSLSTASLFDGLPALGFLGRRLRTQVAESLTDGRTTRQEERKERRSQIKSPAKKKLRKEDLCV